MALGARTKYVFAYLIIEVACLSYNTPTIIISFIRQIISNVQLK